MDSYLSARFWSRCGRGGQVVNVRAVYSDDPSLNPTYVEIIVQNEAGFGPFVRITAVLSEMPLNLHQRNMYIFEM